MPDRHRVALLILNGPASIYCDLCRDEVKRAQNALRAQAYRQCKASYGGVVRSTHPPVGPPIS